MVARPTPDQKVVLRVRLTSIIWVRTTLFRSTSTAFWFSEVKPNIVLLKLSKWALYTKLMISLETVMILLIWMILGAGWQSFTCTDSFAAMALSDSLCSSLCRSEAQFPSTPCRLSGLEPRTLLCGKLKSMSFLKCTPFVQFYATHLTWYGI